MGKAAENEQHKLRATFYNNIAITAAASGVLLPVFGLITKYGDWARGHRVTNATEAVKAFAEIDVIGVVAFFFVFGVTAWVAYAVATVFREKSDAEAANIRD